jgi:hypothetical protein
MPVVVDLKKNDLAERRQNLESGKCIDPEPRSLL